MDTKTARIRALNDELRQNFAQGIAVRKATLASLLARVAPGLRFNEHLDETNGPLVFQHACKLGLEGIGVEAEGLGLSLGTLAGLDQEQEPGGAGREARSRGGLGAVTTLRAPARGRGSQRGTRSARGNWGFWAGRATTLLTLLRARSNTVARAYPRCSHPAPGADPLATRNGR